MSAHTALLVLATICAIVQSLPVKQPTTTSTAAPEAASPAVSPEHELHYSRYLQEVVQALETDPDFKAKLDKAEQVDIRSGQIAHELEYVHHSVRNELDEIKRREIIRLRELATKQYRLTNDIDVDHGRVSEHLHQMNPHTFEIEDLKMLILKTSSDLSALDEKRRQEFKEYEMQKEFEKSQKLEHMAEQERALYKQQLAEKQAEHLKHDRVHYPGNKAQLEEVWEKQDHMDPDSFDPKMFYRLHDLDENGFWDEYEVKALFQKELDKTYDPNNLNDDQIERAEEMERMREEVFRRSDTNHDDLISFDEFIAETKRNEFKEDPNWKGVDEQPQFTHDEYVAYEQQQQEHIRRMIAEGKLPANYNDHLQQQQQHSQQPPAVQQPQQQYQQPPPVQQQRQQPPQQPHPAQQQYQQPPPVQQQQHQQQQYQQPPPAQQQQQQQFQQPPPVQQPQQQYQQPPAAPQQQQYQQPPAAPQQQQYQQPPAAPQQQQYQQPPAAPQQQQQLPQQQQQPQPHVPQQPQAPSVAVPVQHH